MIWLWSVYDTISNFVNYTTSVGKLEAIKGNHAWSDNLFAEWLSKNHFHSTELRPILKALTKRSKRRPRTTNSLSKGRPVSAMTTGMMSKAKRPTKINTTSILTLNFGDGIEKQKGWPRIFTYPRLFGFWQETSQIWVVQNWEKMRGWFAKNSVTPATQVPDPRHCGNSGAAWTLVELFSRFFKALDL